MRKDWNGVGEGHWEGVLWVAGGTFLAGGG